MQIYTGLPVILFVLTLTPTSMQIAPSQSDGLEAHDLNLLDVNIHPSHSPRRRHAGNVELRVRNTSDRSITGINFDLVITYEPTNSKNCDLPNPMRYSSQVDQLMISPNEEADIKTNISLRCLQLPFIKQIVRVTKILYSDGSKWERSKFGLVRVRAEVPSATPVKLVEPPYPMGAWVAQDSGEVIVEVTLDQDGNVTSARAILGSSPSLKGMAEATALECRFKVESFNDERKELVGKIVFDFQL